MNERGSTLVEALVVVSILFLIVNTFIPLLNIMKTSLIMKERSFHATETAYYAVNQYVEHRLNAGVQVIDGIEYEWEVDHNKVCVSFPRPKGEESKCLSF